MQKYVIVNQVMQGFIFIFIFMFKSSFEEVGALAQKNISSSWKRKGARKATLAE